jgi:hypothetical protein
MVARANMGSLDILFIFSLLPAETHPDEKFPDEKFPKIRDTISSKTNLTVNSYKILVEIKWHLKTSP